MKRKIPLILFFIVFFRLSICVGQGCFPVDKLPSHISALTDFGERAEWSLDGKIIYYLDHAGGEVWAIDILTKELKQITKLEDRPQDHGYFRVFVMWNGSLLLGHGDERHKLHFQILDAGLKQSPWAIEGEFFDEGAAVSRISNKIAWTYPGQRQIYTGEFHYSSDGKPTIRNKKLILDNSNKPIIDEEGMTYSFIIETQDFNPKNENILIWNQYLSNEYSFRSEVMSINLLTGNIENLTNSPHTYDEAENIFPSGEYIAVESDRHRPAKDVGGIDIYKFRLDGATETYERLTYCYRFKGLPFKQPRN
jgi:hypothetical protein